MKQVLHLCSKIRGYFSASQSNDVGYDCRLTVVRPSFDSRSAWLKLCSVLAILLTVGIGSALGTTATFSGWSYSKGSITGGTLSGAPTGATASLTTTYTAANQMTNGNSQTLTLSGFDGYEISGVTVHVRCNKSSGAGSGTLTINGSSAGSLSSQSGLGDSYTNKSFSVTSTVVGTGGTIVITLTASASSFWCDSYSVTYETTSPHTITFNAGTGTCGTASSGSVTSYTLPSASPSASCASEGWAFAGWKESSAQSSASAPASKLWQAGETYSPAADIALYAVYFQASGNNYEYIDNLNSLFDGAKMIITAYNSGDYAVSNTMDGDGYIYSSTVSPDGDDVISSPANSIVWTLNGYKDNWTLKNVDNNKYIIVSTLPALANASETFSITYEVDEDDYDQFNIKKGSKYLYMWSSDYTFSGYNKTYLYFYQQQGTFNTNPSCCTNLGTINGSVSLTNEGCSAGQLKATWKMNATTGIASQVLHVYDADNDNEVTASKITDITASTSNQTQTITGLTPCHEYYVKVENISSGGSYCGDGFIADKTSDVAAGAYSVTSTAVTNVTPATSFPTTTCPSGFSIASMTPAVGYSLPSTITVTNASHTWNSSTGALTISSVTGNVTITIEGQVTANFTNGETVFIQADSKDYSAWKEDACVKAYFTNSGSDGALVSTNWLFDATGTDNGKKLFAIVVPASGTLNQVQLQRFQSDCLAEHWWNNNGIVTKASSNGVNTFRSYGSADNNVSWNGSSTTLYLHGDPSGDDWASSLATFADQGGGVWTATYSNYTPDVTSADFKIKTNYNVGWIGNTGSNNNATLSDMIVGSTYNVTATLDVTDHSLVMSKTFVKGEVSFDLQGHGSAISKLTNVTAGSKISAPSAPSATGYDFGGWYKEPACTNAWNFGSDVVNETMTLYAKWTAHEYTITKTLTNVTSSPAIPSTYTYTGAAAGLNYTISPSDGYRLPTTITVTGTTYTWNSSTGALTLTGTITSNVSITITAVQTHTVTWMNNGSNYGDPVVYDHGAALVLPASDPSAPSSCSEKVFVGWTSDSEITTETSTEPTLITAGGAVNADATYRAVFADEEGGGTVTVLSEPFTGFSDAAIPSSPGGSATTLDGSSMTYTCTPGGSNAGNTNIQTSGGPDVGHNILIRKKNGAFTVNSIPTNSQATATLTYKWRGSGTMSLSGSSNISLGSISTETDASSNNTCTVTITINSGTTYSLTWTNSSTDDNLRFDVPTITCGGTSYDNYITQCCSLKPVTGLAVTSMTANSVTLGWTAPSPTTGIDHLELRNASTNAKIGSDISVGTTTATVSDLTECETYSYKVVSVGSCEMASATVNAQPYSGAKTITYKYHDDATPDGSFTTDCSHTSTNLPNPSRTGYTLNGWFTDASGGTKKGNGGASYTPDADITLHAQWSQTNYTVTMAQSPSVGATLTGGTTTAHYGGTINISTDVPSGYRFDGWTASPSVTFASSSSTSTSFSMPASDVTITANFVQIHTLTFTVPTGGGSAVTPPATADHGGTVTLPNVTGIAAEYSCETFLGWTTTAPNGSGTWVSTPTYKAADATSDAINSNTTFYAVYSRSGAGASGTVTLDAAAITAVGTAGGHAYADAEWSITAADLSTWAARAYVGNKGTYLQIKEDAAVYIKLPTVGGNYRSITLNHNSNTSSRTIVYRTSTGGSNVASCTTPAYGTSSTIDISSGSTAGYIMMTGSYTYQITSITASYGPPPVISHTLECGCLIDQFDLTYDANTANFPGSTTSCSGVDDYVFASHENKYTICSTEPTLSGYKFTGWTTNANGSGEHYDAGQEISCVPSADVTLYAQYERVYTVTFNNQGVTTPVTQASEGATIAVPSATSPCSAEWAFVGWSETAIAPMSMLPALEITAGTSTYTPTADKTLYAIYRKTSESSSFVAGMSGAYKITNGSTVYAGACNNSKLPETNAAGAYVFYIKYTSADGGKYTIQQADGKYLKYAGSSTSLALDDETPYYWTMTKNGDLWHVLAVGTDRYLQHSSETGFKAYNTSGYTDIAFVAAEGQYYYRTMSCATEYDITFHNNGTTINWADGHPEASYKDLADATVVSTFPTATFSGWTFLGWRTADYEESTTAPSASGIYSTGGNALTISSADVDLYPVFTRFEDNEPFDQINGGDYYIYYLKSSTDAYGAYERVYACSYADSKRYNQTTSCASATEFTFTKEGDIWHIYDKATGKYVAGVSGDNDLVHKSDLSGDYDDWTIEVVSGNQFEASCQGGTRRLSFSTAANYFMNYETAAGPGYLPVYLGSCTERTFTTNPSITPNIEIHGEVKVTSTATKSVKAKTALTVSASNISTANLTVTSDNSAFKFSLTSNGTYTANVNIPVVSNKVGVTPIYMEYTPTATSDGIEGAIVTVSDGAGTPTSVSTTAGDVQGRHLPAKFLIATKVGDDWYALPNNTGSYGNPAAVKLSSVNEGTGVATYYSDQYDGEAVGSKNYLTWTLNSVVSGSDANYGYTNHGNRVRFYDSKNSKYLEFGTGDNVGKIQNNRVTSTPASVLHIASELLPTTSDLIDYTLLNEGQTKYLGVDGSKMWGAYAGSTTVRFLIPNQQPAPTITWYNNMLGEQHGETSKAENGVVPALPTGADPAACSAATSLVDFFGWSTTTWEGYKTSTGSYTPVTVGYPTTTDKTYYAVFKHKTEEKYFTNCPTTQTVTYYDGVDHANDVVETYFVDCSGKAITCKEVGTGDGQINFTKSGSAFIGWMTNSNYASAFKYAGNSVTLYNTSCEQASKGDLVLTAVWVGELTITGDVHLTSTYTSAARSEANTVYTTSNPNNLLTVSVAGVPAARASDLKIRVSYLTSADESQASSTCPFRLCNDGSSNYNIVDGGNLDITSGDYSQTYAIGYKPGVTGGTNGTTETYKLKMELINTGGDKVFSTAIKTLYGRVLPNHFVIAAKINGQWCALPADIATSSGSAIANAYPITVNNQTTPTVATSAPKAALYSGTVRAHNDHRGGIRLTTATGDGYDGQLQATRSDNTYLWRTTSDCTTGMQEWYLVSSNFSQYEVRLDPKIKRSSTDAEDGADGASYVTRQLCVNGSQILFGTTSAKTMYILPVTEEFDPVEIQVVTWKSNAVQFMYFGNPAYTAEVEIEGVNKASAQELGSALKIDHGVYEIAVSDLMSNANKQMHIIIKNGGSEIGRKAVTIPLMTNSATTVNAARNAAGINKGDCSGVDLVVLGNVLTADDVPAHEFNSVTVYGGAKLSVTGNLTAKKMYLRAGNVTAGTKGTTPVTSYSYVYPQVYVGSSSTLTINENIINFDYLTNYDQYFGVAFPHTLTIDKNNIFYPADIYGSAAKTGSFLMRVFDSQIRATSGAVDNVWVDVEEGSTAMPKQTTTTRGLGYYVLLPPRKVSVNGGANTRQTYGIQRMKMSVANAAALTTAENNDATIAVTAYSASSIVNTGWWMLGNPYMASLNDGDRVSGASITVGSIGTNAQGQYEWKSSSVRYVTVPDDGAGDTYDQRRVIDYDFPAFKPFYVQVGASGDVTFSYTSRNTAAPARFRDNSMPNEINVSVALNTAAYGDTTYLLIGDAFSAAYEIGDDLMKMPHANVSLFTIGSTYDLFANALNKQSAEAGVPVGYAAPSAGSYEFSYVETDESAWLEHLWLEDKATETTVDLLDDSYEFETDAGTNKTRFVLFAVLKQPSETPTDIGGISDENVDKPMKFIYREKMYILRGGQIYDATGKKVREINK